MIEVSTYKSNKREIQELKCQLEIADATLKDLLMLVNDSDDFYAKAVRSRINSYYEFQNELENR